METNSYITKELRIKKITLCENEDVYDATVEDNHNFFANGILVHNCSELSLSAYGSCILMLMNLLSFIDNQYTEKASINIEKIRKNVKIATRLMDDMIDLEIEKINNIIEKIKKDKEPESVKAIELDLWNNVLITIKKGRRVGLGITALADMLAAMNAKYDSDKAITIIDQVFSEIHNTNFKENAILAKERGSFECFDWEKEKDNKHIKMLPQDIQDLIKQYGRRNIALTTCAPAGSMSIIAQTSSGIEPVFMRTYIRRKKITSDEEKKGIKAAFTDSDGNKWIEFEVSHKGIERWKQATGKTNIKESPYWGCDSSEINWKNRIRLQSTVQKYINSSISSTLNLPKEATQEEVSQIYLEAWKSGCKGLTIYRDGCREGVLVSKDNSDDKFAIKYHHAHKRNKVLKCDIHYSTIQNKDVEKPEHYIFFVGLDDNEMPYEILGGKLNKVLIPKKFKNGLIAKNGKNADGNSTYDLYLGVSKIDEEIDEKLVIKDIANEFKPDQGSYTRNYSVMLRHGIPINIMHEQIQKDTNQSMLSFEKCVARILKKYIKDGEKSTISCDNCGTKLTYKDGCVICLNCGNSKCS